MPSLFVVLVFLAVGLVSPTALAGADKPAVVTTRVNHEGAKAQLMGNRRLMLQWVSWEQFGKATVTDNKGLLSIKGEHRLPRNPNYLTIDGVITEINEKNFGFRGTIVTSVDYVNKGAECIREGDFTFRISGKRQYWRMAEMQSPCSSVTDYVDVFFAEAK
jgi:hypothetical protein